MKENKGFTLIELLTVIVVLGIISLIATPVVLNLVSSASKNTIKNSGEGLLKSAKTYYGMVLAEDPSISSKTFTFPTDAGVLDVKGDVPTSGTLTIDKDGNVSMAVIYQKKWCVTKDTSVDNVKVSELRSTCTVATADNLITNGYLELKNNTNFTRFTYDKNGYLTLTTRGTYTSNEYIPVNTSKTYTQTVEAKSSNTTATYYMGLQEFDVDKKEISAYHVAYIDNTLTTLARDLKNGDTVIYLASTANFLNLSTTPTHQLGLIFWNYTDGTGKTWPELTYSRNAWLNLYLYTGINKTNNTITLKSPWANGTFKAGTKLSQSNSGGYNYGLMANRTMSTGWTTYTNKISGEARLSNYQKFRFGTRYVRFLSLENYNNTASTTTNYRNITFKEV